MRSLPSSGLSSLSMVSSARTSSTLSLRLCQEASATCRLLGALPAISARASPTSIYNAARHLSASARASSWTRPGEPQEHIHVGQDRLTAGQVRVPDEAPYRRVAPRVATHRVA